MRIDTQCRLAAMHTCDGHDVSADLQELLGLYLLFQVSDLFCKRGELTEDRCHDEKTRRDETS